MILVNEEFSCGFGDVVFREVNGKTIACRKPTGTDEPTEGQLAHRDRFKQAVAYGKSAMANPVIHTQYQEIARRRNAPVFSLMIADFFNPPTISSVDVMTYYGAIGDTISIHVSGDFSVVNVYVTIQDLQGNPVEMGQAAQSEPGSNLWIYTASVQHQPTAKFQIVAMDRPGGTTVMNLDKTF